MRLELRDRGFGAAGFELDDCRWNLPQPLVCDAHDARSGNRLMEHERAFDRLRQELETTAHDRAIGATAVKQESVFVNDCDIGRADPVGSDARTDHFKNT